MPITYSLTRKDFQLYRRVVAKRLTRGGSAILDLLVRVIAWGFMGYAGASVAHVGRRYPELHTEMWIAIWLAAAALILASLIPYFNASLWSRKALLANGSFLAPKTLAFSTTGIVIASPTARSEILWNGILAREEDLANYYLFIDAAQAVVLPRTAISTQLREFESRTGHLKNVA